MSNAIDWVCGVQMSEATRQIECNTIETYDKEGRTEKD